jgi:hypothetical protein
LSGTERTRSDLDRCPVCGYRYLQMATVTRLYGERVHRRCRDGLPEDLNPNSRFTDNERRCTECGASVDDECYELWLFSICRDCNTRPVEPETSHEGSE